MGLPDSGTYEIVNFETNRYFDLKNSNIAPGNNVIGFPQNGRHNQKWILEREGNIITLHSILSPQAGVATKSHVAGSQVIVGRRERFELIEERTGLYRIKVPGQNLVFRLASAVPGTPVTIDYNGKGNDLWSFIELPYV